MIPAISSHFVVRARERAPWLLDLERLQNAIERSQIVDPPRSIYAKIRDANARSSYLLVPKSSPVRPALLLVVADNRLVTLYMADESLKDQPL